jgi:hypothetical protein
MIRGKQPAVRETEGMYESKSAPELSASWLKHRTYLDQIELRKTLFLGVVVGSKSCCASLPAGLRK